MRKYVLLFLVTMFMGVGYSYAQSTPAPQDTTAWFKVSDTALYKGKYKVEGMPFEYVEISVKDSKLYFHAGEYEGFLEPLKDRKEAFDALGQAVFTFNRIADGTDIDGLKIDYNGSLIEGKKEKK